MKAKTELSNRLTATLTILGLLVPGLAFSEAYVPTPYEQVCVDAWDDAPASDVCTAGSVFRLSQHGKFAGNCLVVNISCSVSATKQDGETQTWTLSPSSASGMPPVTATYDVCFRPQRNSENAITGYTASFKAGCPSDDVTSENMSDSELPY